MRVGAARCIRRVVCVRGNGCIAGWLSLHACAVWCVRHVCLARRQVRVADVDPETGVALKRYKTYAFSGFLRFKVRTGAGAGIATAVPAIGAALLPRGCGCGCRLQCASVLGSCALPR